MNIYLTESVIHPNKCTRYTQLNGQYTPNTTNEIDLNIKVNKTEATYSEFINVLSLIAWSFFVWKNKGVFVQNYRLFLTVYNLFLIFWKYFMVCIYSCIKWKGALLVCEKSLTKIVQNWFWILYLWFKKDRRRI